MKKLVSGICAMAIVASMGIASAAPAIKTQTPAAGSNVIQAQVGVREDGRLDYRAWDFEPGDPRPSRNFVRPDRDYGNYRPGRDYNDYRDYRPRRDRGYVRNWDRPSYYRGHRGYRDYRPGYREYNGFWYPAGAFIAGAIIGGAISQPTVRSRNYGSAHVEWCYDRYRSYRASDNTFQPYNGPRRECRSPYY